MNLLKVHRPLTARLFGIFFGMFLAGSLFTPFVPAFALENTATPPLLNVPPNQQTGVTIPGTNAPIYPGLQTQPQQTVVKPPLAPPKEKEAADEEDQKNDPDKQKINFGQIASMFVGIFTPIIAILVDFIGELMGTKVIYGTFYGAGTADFREILHTVWLVFRDLVNYLFILVLLAIAFMSVFGSATPENNNYELKKLLPKFILAVIGVNFTWFGAQVILDAANVATHVVYAIPKTLVGDNVKTLDTECTEEVRKDSTGADVYGLTGCYPLAVFIRNSSEKTSATGWQRLSQASSDSTDETEGSTATSMLIDLRNSFMANVLGKEETGDLQEDEEEQVGTLQADTGKVTFEQKISEFLEKRGAEAKYRQDYARFTVIWSDFAWEKFQSNSIAALFAYNVLEIQQLPSSVRDLSGYTDIEDLIIGAGFALIMMIIIIVAYVVMAIVLFERIIIIWVNIILSPLGALLFAIKDFGIDGGSFADKGIGLGKFVEFAFLPATMGLPLTVGYILIYAGQTLTGSIDVSTATIQFEAEPIHGVHTIHELLWRVLAVGVLWGSVSIAENTAIYLKEVITGVTGTVKSVGAFIGKLPLYAQFIPISRGSGGGDSQQFSISGLYKAASMAGIALDRRSQREMEEFTKKGAPDMSIEIKNAVGNLNSTELHDSGKKLEDVLLRANMNMDEAIRVLNSDQDWKKSVGLQGISNLSEEHVRNAGAELAARGGLTNTEVKNFFAPDAVTKKQDRPTTEGIMVVQSDQNPNQIILKLGGSGEVPLEKSEITNASAVAAKIIPQLNNLADQAQLEKATKELHENGVDVSAIGDIQIANGGTYTVNPDGTVTVKPTTS